MKRLVNTVIVTENDGEIETFLDNKYDEVEAIEQNESNGWLISITYKCYINNKL